jgi:L-ascorbate metabolism protein UlaG (beta-lactamase superfamily)
MIITYHGVDSIKLVAGDTTLALGPVSKRSDHKASAYGSDIAFISVQHRDMNGAEEVARGDKQPFVVQGPGEYEVQGLSVVGVEAQSNYGDEAMVNTVYAFKFDGMSVVYLGALSGDVPKEIFEDMESVDVLFLPVGGEGVLDAAQAHKVAVKLEPKIIIPIHWDGVGEKDALKKYLKEAGSTAVPVDKLTIKRKDLDGKEGEVVVVQA